MTTTTPTPTETSTPTSVTIHVGSNFFDPKEVIIQVGDTVSWVRDEGFHSVTAEDGSFEQPASSSWSTFSHTFNTPGEFPYYCSVHGGAGGVGMSGKVIVQGSSTPTPTPTNTPVPASTPTPTPTAVNPTQNTIYLPYVQK
jgi:plastocyanin